MAPILKSSTFKSSWTPSVDVAELQNGEDNIRLTETGDGLSGALIVMLYQMH